MSRKLIAILMLVAIVLSTVAGDEPAMAATGDPVLINEILASHSGTDDTEFVEFYGTPGYSLSGLSLIVVEGDAFDPGRIDRRFDFKPFHQIGPNGFFLYGNCAGLPSNYGEIPDASLFTNYFENSSLTVALVETDSLSGDVGDLISGSEVVRSAIALNDGDPSDQFFFGAPVIGPDGPFFPAGARRVVDGVDTGSPDDWVIASFSLPGNNTPTGGGFDGCAPIPLSIPEIQGAGHISPYVGETVITMGVVTAVSFDSFYVQDPVGDGDDTTSDGISVYMGSFCNGCPDVGDLVQLTDTIEEYIPGGAGTGNLSTTQMAFSAIAVLSTGNPLPLPVIIGLSGRIPPNVDVISEGELPVNLQTDPGVFNPDNDGIDFYESLEGMLVTVEDAVAVSAVRAFGDFSSELFTLPNGGHPQIIEPNNARTDRGGIKLFADPDGYGDLHPERVQVQFDASDIRTGTLYPSTVPPISVGDWLGNVTGVVGYDFGNFEVRAIEVLSIAPSGLAPETTYLGGTQQAVTVASYNVLNLSPLPSDDDQRAMLAYQVVNNLGSPDVIALQEIQDNSGEADDGETDATETLQALVDAIFLAGGPVYSFFDVAPEDGTSGGVPGGNIRNAFLYNPDRVGVDGYVSLTPDVLAAAGVGNPDAFYGSRNPLAATFVFNGGATFTVINNHLSSRSGSSPIFGGPQPFFQAAEDEREAQLQALNDYVDFLLSTDKDARVIVAGDFNTFDFTDDLAEILPGTLDGKAIMKTLLSELPDDNRYTYIFDGNSQVLDHMFATRSLLENAEYDIVHVNVDFPRLRTDTVASDHEPIVGRFGFDD